MPILLRTILCLVLSLPVIALGQTTTGQPGNTPPASDTTIQIQAGETATISELQGSVLVYQGENYVPASVGMRVRDGDRIMTMRDSFAKLVYDNGCLDEAKAFKLYDVASQSPFCVAFLSQQVPVAVAPQSALGTLTANPGITGSILALIGARALTLNNDDDGPRLPPPVSP